MSDNKTQPTAVAVDEFIAGVPDEQKRADSIELVRIMQEITGDQPTMWGPSIIGFGSYHYKYETGREGDMPVVGFSPRKAALTLYLMGGLEEKEEQLSRLGKHTTGKGCIYVKKLKDIDTAVLSELIQSSVDLSKQSHS